MKRNIEIINHAAIIAFAVAIMCIAYTQIVSAGITDKMIPDDAVQYNGHYYYVFERDDMDYEDAVAFLEARGGYLACLTSAEEDAFAFKYIKSLDRSNVLFGLSDSQSEGSWKWENGEPFSYSNWGDGEPNGETGENYGMYYQAYPDGTWNDGGFDVPGILCEWDSDPGRMKKGSYNGHKYQLYNGAASWESAKAFCESQGGYLAVPDDVKEDHYIFSYISSFACHSAYFGVFYSDKKSDWITSKGKVANYRNWAPGEPNDYYEPYAMYYWKYTDGSWNDGAFSDYTENGGYSFICEWDTDGPKATKGLYLKYNANGGKCKTKKKAIKYGKKYGKLPTPTRKGYTFNGWYTKKTSGKKVTKSTVFKSKKSKTIYAHWSKKASSKKTSSNKGSSKKSTSAKTVSKKYAITYVLKGGKNSSVNPSSYTGSKKIVLKEPTKEGYAFKGWYTSKDCKITTKIKSIKKGSKKNYTLYAKWVKKQGNAYGVAIATATKDMRGATKNSANLFAEAVRSRYPKGYKCKKSNVKVETDKGAYLLKKSEIRTIIKNTYNKSSTDNDIYYIGYFGHGKADEANNGEGFWVESTKKDSDQYYPYGEFLSMIMKEIPKGDVVLLVDTCYSGGYASKEAISGLSNRDKGRLHVITSSNSHEGSNNKVDPIQFLMSLGKTYMLGMYDMGDGLDMVVEEEDLQTNVSAAVKKLKGCLKADSNKDKKVTIKEIHSYMKKMANGLEHPQYYSESSSFCIFAKH